MNQLFKRSGSLCCVFVLISAASAQGTRNRTEWRAPEVEKAIGSLEKQADVFEDHFERAMNKSSYNGTHTEDVLARWADMLEDEIDDMAKAFKNSKTEEFNDHFENSMIVASALNRAMLRKDFAQHAESDWRALRQDLNHIAAHSRRPVLPNITLITISPATGEMMNKADVKQAMEQIEASTDRFEDKLRNSLRQSTVNMTKRQLVWNRWADILEDSSDSMLGEFKDKDAKNFQEQLERTLMVAEALNRMMLRSDLSPDAEVEWRSVRSQLNTVAGAFGYPIVTQLINSR